MLTTLRRMRGILCAVALLVFGSGTAFSTTIGFEGVAPDALTISGSSPYLEAGFELTFSTFGYAIYDSAFGGTIVNHTTDILGWCGFCLDPPLPITLSTVSGSPFSFKSFDATNLNINEFPSVGMGLKVVGHLNGGGTVTQNVSFAINAFNTFDMDIGFTDLLSVDFTGTEGGVIHPTNNIAIDNLVVASSAIPESTTLAIFGFGLAGLGFLRRRRRAA